MSRFLLFGSLAILLAFNVMLFWGHWIELALQIAVMGASFMMGKSMARAFPIGGDRR